MRAGIRTRLALLLGFGLLVGLPACGGGATDGGSAAGSALVLKNNPLTFGGGQNSHAITGFRCTPTAGGEAITSGLISLMPGATLYQPVPSGTYNVVVTFDDGHAERLQIPPDQVEAPAEGVATVTFLY